MFITTRLLETNEGVFKKGDTISDELARKYFRYVEEVKPKTKSKKKTKEPKEELLFETPTQVEVTEETKE